MSRWFQAVFCGLVLTVSVEGANPPPTQLFYVPFPEDQQLEGFDALNTVANDPLAVFVTFSAATDGTVIYYDHWEDGYERDITNPVQASTLVFGDGNSANGYPPGNAGDLIPAGTVFNLRNFVTTSTLQEVLDYDARDKIASFKPISVTKTCFPDGTDTLMAGCVEMFEKGLWGVEYRSPVGVDMPTSAAAGNLTFDENVFDYVALSVMAGPGGASVQVDKDNDGTFEETIALGEGQSFYRSSVNVGGHILADKPVQVILFSGTLGSTYASRDTTLLPVYRWATDYYAPVTTPLADGTVTYLYNPGATAITVSYDYRSSASGYTTATVNVPAGGNARVNMSPADGSTHFGAYRFYTTGAEPPVFYAMSAIDADAPAGSNIGWDGGFTLVGKPSLTTQVLLSLGIGRDPYSATNPTENGNPVWLTTSGNGHTPSTVYVDFNGDNAGAFIDPNGNYYDEAHDLRELEQLKLYDPDGDQSGMLIYSLDPAVRIAAVWGQDPATASYSQPGLDVASLVPPLREGDAGKKSTLKTDADGDGFLSAGDRLEYEIRAVNTARSSIPGPFNVSDDFPADTTYVAGSTRYRYTVGGAWQAWVPIPDDITGTPFPLDGDGFPVPGNLAVGQQFQVVFLADVDAYENLSGTAIVNTGQVEISPYGLTLPIQWEDTLYGSIGDRIWNDLNGDGVQDSGEAGIPGITVFADLNNNGSLDPGERHDVTDSSGDYLLAGLDGGTYKLCVDATDIAAANVGYGPTYDLDGITSSHSAVVTLAQAQDRVDADFGYRVGASVGDRVWTDLNGDGVQDAGEPGINGVRVYIDTNNNNNYDPGEPNTVTAGDGVYYIGNLDPGTYGVRVDTGTLPSGANQTFDLNGALDHEASVTLIAAEHQGNLDFGYRGTLSIGDLVWEDVDSDGVSSANITYNINNGRIDLNGDGSYNANDDGFIGTMRIIDGYVDIDNDNSNPVDNGDDGTFLGVNIVNGGFDMNNSGGISTTGSNDDGQVYYSYSEAGIPGVRVFIDTDNDGVFDVNEASDVTDASGNYSIGNLFGGDYIVRVDSSTLPASYVQTYDLTSPSDDHTALVTLSGVSRSDVDFGYRNDASIGDLVWNDRNGDRIRDPGEPGIEGVLVYLDANNNNIFDQASEVSTITDVDGIYHFENLSAGSYNIRIEISTLPQGSTQTHDLSGGLDNEAARVLVGTEDAVDVDFGYRASSAFGDYVWNDLDADGVQDGGESGISGVRVYADINGNGIFDSANEPSDLTDGSGAYSIGNLVPGTYTARVDTTTLPVGMVQTFDAVGANDNAATFFISANQVRDDIDFGYTSPVSIGDFVWNDVNVNGQQDSGELGIEGVEVTVYNAATDAEAGTTTTGPDGSYSFASLLPGTYYVVFSPFSGYERSSADTGSDATDSDAATSTGRTANTTLLGGQSDNSLDAGYYQPGSISGTVLVDTDDDGDGDTVLGGVVIRLLDSVGNPVLDGMGDPVTTETLPDGTYSFGGLLPGDYCVAQDQPLGYASVSDSDGPNDNVIGNVNPIVVTAGNNNGGNDFIEIQLGVISGYVLLDTDDNGSGDTGLPGVVLNLLDASGDPVLDGFGDPIQVASGVGGYYSFTQVPVGIYQVSQNQPVSYGSVSDVDGANNNVIGDETPIIMTPGLVVTGRDFVEIELGSIAGAVLTDRDNDGNFLDPLAGVTLALLDGSGDPVLDGIGDPVSTVTLGDGTYFFPGLLPGDYQVSEIQPAGYGSLFDVDGGDPDRIGNVIAIGVAPGQNVTGRDFIEVELGSISGFVFVGSTPLGGVTLTLLDASGDPVDGDPDTAGVQPITTVTGGDGSYTFSGVIPGSYQVGQTQPFGYNSDGDSDGGDLDIVGDVSPVLVLPGEENANNNFIESLDTCPDDWAEWKFQHPGEVASGNPDLDAYDNLAEFAFAMPADRGTGSPWLGNTAWIIQPSTLAPGTIEGVFIRPKGATDNVTYTLQYAAVAGNPTAWQSLVITSGMITTVDNGDCTETVTLHDLETLTGLTGGEGVVRIQVDLDEEPDSTIDHTSYSETEGWKESALELCCRTYNNPFLRESAFTGTVSAVAGQDLAFAVSAGSGDLATLLASGASYYLEVISGTHEGHRFDISSGSGNTLTLANDADLDAADAPFNTLVGAPSSSLVGDQVMIRRHWTLAENFPADAFGATDDPSTADQVQMFTDGQWTIYWLYDDGLLPPYWVKMGDASYADQGTAILSPGRGMFINNRSAPRSVLAYGELRGNDFIRPLAVGHNLIGGGYPIDQSATGAGSRVMGADDFSGTRDFETADSFFVWKTDRVIGSPGYDSYYLLDNSPKLPVVQRWVKVGDANLLARDAELLLLGNGSVFLRCADGFDDYTVPTPWTP